ncbi:MAG: acyl-CoA synthetase [Deltaproteobacteria bacterium]
MQFNLADLFESVVDVVSEREALVCGERRLSFGQLDERANRLAHYLHGRGVGAGDHVGLHLYNGTEFVEGLLACFKIRAVPVNINYRYVAEELRYMFDNADLVALIHHREFTPIIAELPDCYGKISTLLAVDDDSGADTATIGSGDYEEALAAANPGRGFDERSGDDIYIIYTGGTTGMPKGVMWRHKDVFFAGLQGGNPAGEPIEKPQDLAELVANNPMPLSFMPVAPFIHGAAQWAVLIALLGGGKAILSHKKSLDARVIWGLVEKEKINTLTIVGDAMARPLAEALHEEGASYDISSLLVISSAGAVFSDSIKERLRAKLDSTMLVDSFGSTEAGHTGSMTASRSMSESGHPRFMMGETVTVLDEDWRPLAPGSGVMGKLARRGYLPVGYYNDPEKTAETFREIDGHRWAITGDLASIEEDGTITVFGRGAVCINSGGEKIFPEEVEEALKSHAAVADAIVVGVPDERWGQRVAAVVQTTGDGRTPLTLEEISSHCRKVIAGYKVPRQLHLVEKVARQPSGKPDYRWAQDVATGGDSE